MGTTGLGCVTPGAGQCWLRPSWAQMGGQPGEGSRDLPLPSSVSGTRGQGTSPPDLRGPPAPKAGTPGSLTPERLTPRDRGPRGMGGPPACPVPALPRELCDGEHVTSSLFIWVSSFVKWKEGCRGRRWEVRRLVAAPGRDPWQPCCLGAALPPRGSVPPHPWGGFWSRLRPKPRCQALPGLAKCLLIELVLPAGASPALCPSERWWGEPAPHEVGFHNCCCGANHSFSGVCRLSREGGPVVCSLGGGQGEARQWARPLPWRVPRAPLREPAAVCVPAHGASPPVDPRRCRRLPAAGEILGFPWARMHRCMWGRPLSPP